MDVVLPKWGVSMQEAVVAEWLVEVGTTVAEGQPIVTVETDKIDAEVEAPVGGVLTAQLAEVGGTVEVGAALAVIDETAT